MKNILFVAFLFVSLPAAATSSLSSEEPYVKITNYGIVTNQPPPKAIYLEPSAPAGISRKYAAKDMVFLETTDRIPAKLGTRFGLAFEIFNMPNFPHVALRTRVRHPPMKKPDGTTTTEFEYTRQLAVTNGATYGGTSYRLDHDEEVLPGVWIFEYYFDEKLLFSKSFTLVEVNSGKEQ
jgi:hypothetical protein